jgi:predicted dehydrogenase
MTEKSGYVVLIVGCGQIGSRHLQAVAALPQVCRIEIVDPQDDALGLGRERLLEVPDRQLRTSFRWLPSLDDATRGGDLCIISTQADVRCQLVRRIVSELGYSSFMLEKFIAQSVQEYEGFMDFAEKQRLSVWVNCKGRAHPSHQRVKAHLDPSEPIIFSMIGGNHGLVNNGVHAADLFVFYDGADRIESAGAFIDPVLHPSMHGKGLFDLSGTLHGCTKKGSQFFLSFAADHTGPGFFSVASRRYRAVIDDVMHWLYESTIETGWAWRKVPFEANLMISNMTRAFAADILASGRCELPTLQDCFPAHRFILEELLPHFNRLLGVDSDRCPVT